MLELRNINKSFGEQIILKGLNMFLEKGKIHTLIGGNGAGKTTLFNLITGFLRPDSGEIWYKKKRIDNQSPNTINSLGITRTFQDLRIISQLSVKENILLAFKNNPGEKILNSFLPSSFFRKQYLEYDEKAEIILSRIHLTEVKNSLAGNISFGQQKLLTIGCCLSNSADTILIDEPVAGIDKDNYQRIYDLIIKLKNEGKTILQIEHNHGFIEPLSDIIWFINSGQAIRFDNYVSFINNDFVKSTYLS